jgi:DNA-binding NarL/FixJ family response regulator
MVREHQVAEGAGITSEELKVVELIASGLTDKAVARRIGVSVVTIRRRATSFRKKVGARTRPEAVAIAVGQGWIVHHGGTPVRLRNKSRPHDAQDG